MSNFLSLHNPRDKDYPLKELKESGVRHGHDASEVRKAAQKTLSSSQKESPVHAFCPESPWRASLEGQGLRHHTPKAESMGLMPGQG